MTLGGCVSLQLVQGRCEEVAGVAAHLHRAQPQQEPQLPLVLWAAFPDVIEEGQAGQVFVRLQVQLEVGLQAGLVGAEAAQVEAGHSHCHLELGTRIGGAVQGQVAC